MFNFDAINEVVTTAQNVNVVAMESDHVSMALSAETLADMTRPVMRLSTNERIAAQQQFNRGIALMVKKADRSTIESLQELATQAVHRLSTSRQSEDDEATLEAQERLEKVINFFGDVAGNITRNSFYRHEECVRQEQPVADSKFEGIDGASGAFETKSKYAGWQNYRVESDAMKEGAEMAVEGMLSVVRALLPMASSYLQGLLTSQIVGEGGVTTTTVHVQLGYRRDIETGETNQFYTVQDTWNDLAANRKVARAPMKAEAALASFKL